MLGTLVKEGAFSWILGNRNSFDEDFEEMSKSPSSRKNWLPELSSKANLIVRRCSRNFLEYCCFQTLSLSTQVNNGHLGDKKFQRLTYDMMLAWEAPAATSQPSINVDEECTVGREAFSRITPSVPTISDVITCENLFDLLTTSTGGRLCFSVYEKYVEALEREERILELDGTVTTQPVLEHFGGSTWPGRLTLTDYALYFEAHTMVSFEKVKTYELSEDLKQVVKPELTGPWGARLFDKGDMYKSVSLPEPIVMEFPELNGHCCRDYWLAVVREILYAHKFIRKFNIEGVDRDEIILKAVIGILWIQAVLEITTAKSVCTETLLMFNQCDRLPGGP
ncbi:hypothetical protein MKX01_017669 [Papaver californicum]|nr:hypothetical protein MKX01_017669 [Papaver californicum]